ncbi:MAG: hypothetical protein Q7R44_00830, partial [bacterium]|nr:hypothetical protein [bacterium]
MTVERPVSRGAEKQTEISPTRELLTIDGKYRWLVYDFGTGLKDLCLEDLKTGLVVVTPLVSDTTRVAAHKAWKGARQSRAPGTPWEITHEMQQKGVDADQKQDEMFSSYGHKSVGDMARIQLEYAYLPMHLCWALFNNLSINGGQEKSTRYQKKFQDASLHLLANYLPEGLDPKITNDLERKYQRLGQLSLEFFGQHRNDLTALFTDYYEPRNGKEKSALDSRVLDCSRYFLLFGMYSGLAIETSARDWSRVIGEFRASPVPFYQSAAEQMQRLLTPTLE